MKRKAVIFFLMILFFLLETAILPMVSVLSAVPNMLIILTASIGFMQGKKEGMAIGFLSGLFIDITFGELFGVYALIYLLIGYVSGFFTDIYFDEDVRIPLLLVFTGDFFLNVVVYILSAFLEGHYAFGSYFIGVILPEMISTVIFTLLFYRMIYLINHSMVEREKKGKQSLWIRD